jgi:hypothetical protein
MSAIASALSSGAWLVQQVKEHTMQTITACVAIATIFSPLALTAGASKHAVEGKWSEPVEGVRVRLSSKKAKYAPGEAIKLTFELHNKTDEKLHLPEPQFLPLIWHAGEHPYDRDAYRWAVNLETPGRKVHIFWDRRQTALSLSSHTLLPPGSVYVVEIEAQSNPTEELRKQRKRGEPQRETLEWVPGKDAGRFLLQVHFQAAKDLVMSGRFGRILELRTPKIEIQVAK